ncbi:hypothetical protein [Geomicrobium sp. JCM 19037]|nr:hypothetical protein [Geomicrobium sp. JCM 19037]
MMILSMDTSTYVLGTAIGTNSEIVAEWTTYKKRKSLSSPHARH